MRSMRDSKAQIIRVALDQVRRCPKELSADQECPLADGLEQMHENDAVEDTVS